MKDARNIGHSVYSKLLNISKTQKEDFSYVLNRYGTERFLYRLSISKYCSEFILKGGSLFLVWQKNSFRVTRDTDLLGIRYYDSESLIKIFKDICSVEVAQDDGVSFLPEKVAGVPIRPEIDNGGYRIKLDGKLHSAKISLQIDIGFGDIVVPVPENVRYPVLLEFETPVLNAYTRYSVFAEKLEAIVQLGMVNSRIKDFYDLWVLKNSFDFDVDILEKAIMETFKRRNTELPEDTPVAFTPVFYDDFQKKAQWKAFVRKTKAEAENLSFPEIVAEISNFILPLLISIKENNK